MRPIHYLMIITLCASLISCKKDSGNKDNNGKVNIRTSIESEATVKSPALDSDGSGNFTDGDTFTLYVSQNGTELNIFDYTVGSTELFWNEINAKGNKVAFSAFYPKQESTDGKFTFDLSQVTDKDLLVAVKTDITPDTEDIIDLKFRHAMHKLNITFKTEESDIDLNNIRTTCTAKSACEINMPDAGMEIIDKTSEFEANGSKVSFMLVPQATSGVSLGINAGNIEKTLTVNEIKPDLDKLESGMQLNIELTIKNGKIEISNASIQGWEDQGTVEGEIII